jgi:hypothetical protein
MSIGWRPNSAPSVSAPASIEGATIRPAVTRKNRPLSPYTFYLDLRFWHPSVDPRLITEALRRDPVNCRRVGERRMTPAGRPIQGVSPRSYWSQNIVRVGDSTELDAETAIACELDRLEPFGDFLLELHQSGGSGMLELNSWSSGSHAFVLPPQTLLKAAYETAQCARWLRDMQSLSVRLAGQCRSTARQTYSESGTAQRVLVSSGGT